MSEPSNFDFRPRLDGLDGKTESAPIVSSSSFPELLYKGFISVVYNVTQSEVFVPSGTNNVVADSAPVSHTSSTSDEGDSPLQSDRKTNIERLLIEISEFQKAIDANETIFTKNIQRLEKCLQQLGHKRTDRITDIGSSEYRGYLQRIQKKYNEELTSRANDSSHPIASTADPSGQPEKPQQDLSSTSQTQSNDQSASCFTPADLLKPVSSSGLEGGMLGYGVLNTYRQDWKKLDVCLGQLLSTISLAPGEVTRLAIIDWQRKSSGTSHEAIAQTDTLNEFSDQSRQIEEIKAGTASRIQKANSSDTEIGSNTTVSAGVSNPTWNAGIKSSLNVSHGVQASYASDTSDLSASGTNRVNQITREMTQAQRSKRSTIIKEVTQSEAERLSTRVVANYNQRHSLNLEYFEILQKYQIVTESRNGQGCVFVPIQSLDFNSKAVRATFASQLFSIFQEDMTLSERTDDLINFIYGNNTAQGELIKGIQEAIQADEQLMQEHRSKVDRINSILNKLNELSLKISARSSIQGDITALKSLLSAADYRELINQLNSGRSVDYYTSAVLKLVDKYEIASKEIIHLIEEKRLSVQARKRQLLNQNVSIQNIFDMNAGYFTQQIIMRLAPTELFCFLSQTRVTIDTSSSNTNITLTELGVQPVAVGHSGNMIAFLWNPTESDNNVAVKLKPLLSTKSNSGSDTSVITLPTSGVFMEAVLGASMAAENTDAEYKDWRNHEHTVPILPPDIDGVASRDRAKESFALDEEGFATQMQSMRQSAIESIASLTDFISQLDSDPSSLTHSRPKTKFNGDPDEEKPETPKPPEPKKEDGDGDGEGDSDGEGIETI